MSNFQDAALTPYASRFLRSAAAYLLIGLALGLQMAMTHDYLLLTVHVHANLLGWATMGICGLVYAVRPSLSRSRLAAVHEWLHQLGLPVMLGGLAALRHGVAAAEAGAAAGSLMVIGGLVCFAVNLFRSLPSSAPGSATLTTGPAT